MLSRCPGDYTCSGWLPKNRSVAEVEEGSTLSDLSMERHVGVGDALAQRGRCDWE